MARGRRNQSGFRRPLIIPYCVTPSYSGPPLPLSALLDVAVVAGLWGLGVALLGLCMAGVAVQVIGDVVRELAGGRPVHLLRVADARGRVLVRLLRRRLEVAGAA